MEGEPQLHARRVRIPLRQGRRPGARFLRRGRRRGPRADPMKLTEHNRRHHGRCERHRPRDCDLAGQARLPSRARRHQCRRTCRNRAAHRLQPRPHQPSRARRVEPRGDRGVSSSRACRASGRRSPLQQCGRRLGGTFEQVTEEDFDWLFKINFHAVVRMTRAFMPVLRKSPRGPHRQHLVASTASSRRPARPPIRPQSSRCAVSRTRCARNSKARNIGVTVVHPGGVATSIGDNSRMSEAITEEEREHRRARLKKFLKLPPAEAGEIIVRGVEKRRSAHSGRQRRQEAGADRALDAGVQLEPDPAVAAEVAGPALQLRVQVEPRRCTSARISIYIVARGSPSRGTTRTIHDVEILLFARLLRARLAHRAGRERRRNMSRSSSRSPKANRRLPNISRSTRRAACPRSRSTIGR